MQEEIINYKGAEILVRRNGEIIDNGKKRKHHINADGYPVVCIKTQNGYRTVAVHILMALAFLKEERKDKYEVHHKDFNRMNWNVENLMWVSHSQNIKYSTQENRHARLYGKDNPNYGNDTLHKKYSLDKELSKAKQSRPKGQNGRAKKCILCNIESNYTVLFDCQREAVEYLMEIGKVPSHFNKEGVIKRLKKQQGYRGWTLKAQ